MSADAIYLQAIALQRKGDYAAAAALYVRVLIEAPDEPQLLLNASVCHLHSGQGPEAVAMALRAVGLPGASAPMFRQLGEALVACGRHVEALEALNRGLALDGKDVETLLALGRVRHFNRDYDGAAQAYLAALAENAKCLPAILGMRAIYSCLGRPDAAQPWKDLAEDLESTTDYGPLVLSEEVSSLSDAEYAGALDCLDAVEAMIACRETLPEGHVGKPSGQWDRSTDSGSLYHILKTRDRDVIRKLRFYSQEFSGIKLPTLEPARGKPVIDAKLPANYDEFLRIWAPAPREHVMTAIMRIPERLRLTQPRKFAEIGWAHGDGILNDDAYFSQVYLVELDEAGILAGLTAKRRTPVVLEIGGGYGNLGRCIHQLLPDTHYIIVDLAESLAFSSIYLRTLFPQSFVEFVNVGGHCTQLDRPGFSFVSSAALTPEVLGATKLDLAINTMSLGEMSDAQKDFYGAAMAGLLADDGVFFEQNHSVVERLDYVGSFIAPYFEEKGFFIPTSLPFVHAGEGHLWRKPRRAEAQARFAQLTGSGAASFCAPVSA
jgi:putative sugar O-methyltransferase